MGEITVILLLALIFLGPAKLPDLATGLGKLIREIRKATSDIKSEITLDDTFRKPFEELRDAVTLHPDELKRRDQMKKVVDEARLRDEAEAREAAAAAAIAIAPVSAESVSAESVSGTPVSAAPVSAAPVSAAPVSVTLGAADAPVDGQVLPPILPSSPSFLTPVAPPAGTVARPRVVQPADDAASDASGPAAIMTSAPAPSSLSSSSSSPLPGPPHVTPPISSLSGDRANITQSLSEADLLPNPQPRPKKPTPPPLPGLEKRPPARAEHAAPATIALSSLSQSAKTPKSSEAGDPAKSATPSPPIGHLGPPRVNPPTSSLSGDRANVTQVLSENDLLPPSAPPLPVGAPKPPPLPGSKKT